ncbi:MAG TPA: ABC transporter ATP-binding protein [Stellaceae bacterium]|nr:ABC transporter ATP-binding protein [Stellaceae bacterium]
MRGIVLRRLMAFAAEFVRRTGRAQLVVGAALVLLAAASEGVGLALLAPLVALLSESAGAGGWIGRAAREALGALGLPLSFAPLLALFIGLIGLRAVVVAIRNVKLMRLGLDFSESWRRRLYGAIADAGWSFLMRQRLSTLLEALTSQIDRIGQGTHFFLRLPAILVVAAVQIAIAVSLSPGLTIGVLGWGALVLAVVHRRFGSRYGEGLALAEAHQAAFDEISDFLQGLKLAKSHGAEPQHVMAFERAVRRRAAQAVGFEQASAKASAAIQIGAALTLGVFTYLGAEVAHVDTAALLVMVVIFSRLAPLAIEIQSDWAMLAQMLPVFDLVSALLARCEAAVEAGQGSASPLVVGSEIRVSNVSFRYDRDRGTPVIDSLDATIAAGAMVAIVGPSGAGKSTLGDLLLGLISPDSGEILIDGVALEGAILASWRRSVGYVPQDNFLFNDTVRANLIWARPDARDDELWQVLSAAAADEFISALPQGLETLVGERGVRLSGGERQRLGLARALLRRPTFLLLDEATSALDTQTEQAVQSAIERLRGGMTIVVIAHRLSTIRNADRILVLNRGRLVQSGSWAALAGDTHGTFAELLRSGRLELMSAGSS